MQKNHEIIADTLNNIGIVYHIRKDFSIAKNYYEDSLNIRNTFSTSSKNTSNLSIAQTFNYMADVHFKLGEHDKAVEFYEKVINYSFNF